MSDKPKTRFHKKKIKQIKEKDRALTLFNLANLALMTNTGTIGIIKAVANLSKSHTDPLTGLQMVTNTTTLIVTALFVLMAIFANRIGRAKRHNELVIKGHELKQQDKIGDEYEAILIRASKKVMHVDSFFTSLTMGLTLIFILASIMSIILQAQGQMAFPARIELIGYSAYILAVLLTLLNKVIGDRLQARVEKQHLGTKATPEVPEHQSIINRLTTKLYRLFHMQADSQDKQT